MDRRLVRMEDHEPVDEVFIHTNANLHATGDSGSGFGRSKLKEVEILAIAGQQVYFIHRQLLGVPVDRFSSIERRQNRTASWTA